jgi:quercetin dioxygenase-like cupin family protein
MLKEDNMKIAPYSQTQATYFDSELARGVAARVVIGKSDGAGNFWMRVFEIAPGGHTPRHSHAWEHEMFIHAGAGRVYLQGQWQPLGAGNVLFIPGQEEHQMENTGREPLVVVCLVPATAPEL